MWPPAVGADTGYILEPHETGEDGAHNGHISSQDIYQLGQLIQPRGAQKPAHAGNSWIIPDFEYQPIHLVVRQELSRPHTWSGIYKAGTPLRFVRSEPGKTPVRPLGCPR